jgi:hypothetical protein
MAFVVNFTPLGILNITLPVPCSYIYMAEVPAVVGLSYCLGLLWSKKDAEGHKAAIY